MNAGGEPVNSGYKIKRHVFKKQKYYPDKWEDVHEYDEYVRLEPGAVIIDSDVTQVTVVDIQHGGDNSAPSVTLSVKQNASERTEHIKPGETVRVDDAGQNCSDYYVQYSFEISVVDGAYEEESSLTDNQ